MKKFTFYRVYAKPILAIFAIVFANSLQFASAQVTLTATAGTATGTFTTVNDAFAAINAGTHQGVIAISINGNTVEPAVAIPLLASGQGASLFTSVLIKPTVVASVTATPTVTNGSVFILDGADNVTFDGSIAIGGTSRDLTIQNSAANTLTYQSVIRLIGRTTLGLGCSNDVIKNTNIIGSTAGNSGFSGSTVTSTHGIYAGGSTTTSTYTTTGFDYDNLTIENNSISKCYVAIAISAGTGANTSDNVVITKNSIGSATIANSIGLRGIYLANHVNAIVSENTIFNIAANTSITTAGIELAGTGSANCIIKRNKINEVSSITTSGYGAYGINITACAGLQISNNVIYSIYTTNYSNTSTTFNAFGIRLAGGTSVGVYYNSINLTGNYTTAATATAASAAFAVTSTAVTYTANNNIFNNSTTSASTGAKSFYAVWLPSGYNFLNGSMNRNYYGVPADADHFVGKIGTTSGSGNYTDVPAWKAVSQINNAANDANSQPLTNALAPFTSTTNLIIPSTTVTSIESGAVAISALGLPNVDYTGINRPAGSGLAPDMGAYEFDGLNPAPFITFTSASPALVSQCAGSSSRLIEVSVTTSTGTVTSVLLNYSVNGVAQTAIAMTNISGTAWTGTIPASIPANALVNWSVLATNSGSYTSNYVGTSYTDSPLLGISAAASGSPTSVCAGGAASVSASLVSSLVANNYTTPTVTNPTSDEDFGSITITQGATTVLTNSSAVNTLTGTLGVATGTAGAYSNFTSFGPHNMTAGLVYNFSISSVTSATSYSNTMAIFIDYNRNGSFADAGEMVYTGAATVSGPHTETGSFTVPLTAFNGLTRMRVVSNEGLIASSAVAPSYGEFEDYLLNITSANFGGGATPAISSISWSDGATVVGTGSPLTVNPTATTTYTATITTLGCPTTASTVITALALPAAPIVTNSTHCGVQVPTASVATGAGVAGTNVYNWFSNPAGTTLAQPYNYGPLSTYYSNNFSSSTFTNSSIIGNASVVGNSLELYPNALSQFGALTVNPSGMNSNKYAFDFKLITQGASASNMADGVSFSFGDDASAPVSATMNAENGTGTKLKVGFVSYTNGTSTQGIYLMYNSTTNEQSPTSPGVLAYNNTNLTWLNDTSLVAMTIDSLGVFNMTLDGVALFTNVQLPAAFLTANKSTWAYVFKGRSGGISSGTTIDDVVIKTSQVIPGNTTLVNPIGTTTMYYVSENGSNGCVSPLSTVVATATLPAPISTSGPDSIFCLGGTYSVTASSTASPAYTYTWTASTATGSGVATSLVGASQTITPTAGGTYSYYVTGQNGICTAVDTVVAVVNSTFPSAPIANPDLFTTCTGSTTLPISATGSPVVGSVTVPFGTGLSNYGTTATVYPATISGVPVGATITSAQLLMTNVNSINGSYRSEIRVATSGAYTLAPTQISTLTTSGTISPDPTITLAGFNATSGVINLLLTETYDDGGASVVDATFGSVSLLINYTLPSDVNWFANPTGGIALGSGATIESVGTSVLASPAANGTYLYYAEGAIPGTGGCVSTTRTTVTVKVESVNVTLTPIDVTCNGFANGSFSLGTVLCGTAPFTYSINGGAFGAIPTNLTAATYSVVVKDALDNSSSPVSVVVAQPAWTINNPIALAGTVCLNDLSEILTASSTLTTGPSASIVWYDAATGGNLLGSNTTLQAIGSSVLPTSTVTGTYNFYAQGTNAGCFSAARTLVPVTVYALPTVNAGVDVVICSNSATNAQTLTGSGSATSYTWNNGVTNAVPFNIASTTTYTVTGTDVNGCQNTDQVLVTVSALPVVNAGPDYTVCVGQNITLSGASAGNTLTWNNGVTNGLAFTVNTVGATTYTVTATNVLGCQNTDQVIVNGNPTPTVSVSANQVVCAGSPVNFNVTTANGTAGFWSTNGLGTITPNVSNSTIAYTAALNDNATVQISYSSFNGCGSTSDTAIVTVNALPTVNAGLDLVACAGSNVSLTGTGSGTLSWDNGVVNSVDFPASVGATTYTLTVTNSNNCVSTDQVVVIGNALPVINAGSDVTICAGDEITLTATGASTYAWDNSVVNGVPFAPTVSGVYSVLGTDGNGCESTSSVNVTINALPGGVATASDEITINATATNATSYQWIDCATNQPIAGETSATFIATVNGSYAVITTNANGCSDTSNCVIVSAVGLGEMIKTIEANLYPNPTSGNVYVTLSNEESVNATIFDAQGKVVVVEMNVQNGSSINMTNLERGMYVVQLTSPRGSFVKRVVKN